MAQWDRDVDVLVVGSGGTNERCRPCATDGWPAMAWCSPASGP